MAYTPNNPNGQATMANSQPVVISSDQSPAIATETTLSNVQTSVDNISTWADNNTLPIPTTAGNTPGVGGYEIFGSVTSAAPTYTIGKVNMLSLSDKGGLRVQLVDTSGNYVNASGGGGGGSTPTALYNNKKINARAGTRSVLASTQTIKSIIIKALSSNLGTIYVGNSTVSSTNGYELNAGESITLSIADLSTIYIDSSLDNEGITYIASN